ncbi:uncharacterized protein LOC125776336 [Bactrocera dorsalis]|uniref:Uncharacterized protein LOC125776336 n=1 Tax=Bactrocera dorsalis TaxID=27457 RepID=A0ABM3J482_BACDO|nr:uncharacterized protein LOC125776336 [Bactrocera dorsalis]XP_049304038.1 uncharacterized protein LOC125776336 [Bactrocera dorsalis]
MFLSTLGLNEKMVRNWVNFNDFHGTNISPEEQNKITTERKAFTNEGVLFQKRLNFLEKWLHDIPKLESLYRRQYTKKLYLRSDFKSYKHVYEVYSKDCETNEVVHVSFPTFMAVLKKKQNSCIFKPKNDMCDTCTSYESKNLTQDQYDIHRKDIQDMRNEKLIDIENAKSGLHLLLCIDMQAVKLIPQTNANATYYKMKLQVHNFTIYNVISHESDNFVWDETDGTLVASTFATCIIKYIKNSIKKSPNIHHIIICSDGCFFQNRNVILPNAILSLCVQENITVEHKYLIVGHTQMECDSTHSLIQRKINKRQINLPSELSGLIRESRKDPFPLKVHHVDYKYFLDYESIPKRYVSIRPGKD